MSRTRFFSRFGFVFLSGGVAVQRRGGAELGRVCSTHRPMDMSPFAARRGISRSGSPIAPAMRLYVSDASKHAVRSCCPAPKLLSPGLRR